ncbi:MAG: HAD family phosphatase [Candidatus Micrarchaeota archaeon]|nr:HAD family phosphatase [Candidatus Micrarchaeota archaeon]
MKGIIYDMDDLLVDSDPLHKEAWKKLLAEYRKDYSDLPEDVIAGFLGMRVIDGARKIHSFFSIQEDFDMFYQKRMGIFLDIAKEKLKLMPGAKESLGLFRRSGFKIALATSGTNEYIDIVLDKFRLREYFDAIVSGDDVKKGKPNPEPYLVTAKRLGMKPDECLVLEDSEKGIESAKAAGCRCIAIPSPNTLPQDRSRADMVVRSLNEITLEMVKKIE